MTKSEARIYHYREAARFRLLAASATTPALKARLLDEADKQEQLAEGMSMPPRLAPLD